MTNHPSRSGAISAVLFAEFLHKVQVIGDDTTAVWDAHLRRCILDAALSVAIQRAARKFHWVPDPKWKADFDSFDQPYNIRVGINHLSLVTTEEDSWIRAEVQKIARNALAALEK